MVRAGVITDGRIQTTEMVRVGREVAEAHPKTRLRPVICSLCSWDGSAKPP
jgi:hypothetical protein